MSNNTILNHLSNSPNKKAILFDLDGTLIDTAPDFIRIIRLMCDKYQHPCPNDTAIREQVSAGARAIVALLLGKTAFDDNDRLLNQYRQEFLALYEANICVDSHLFAGFDELLYELEWCDIAWGIVTNKPRDLSIKLLEQLSLAHRCSVLICPDDVKITKPDPEGLLLACHKLDVSPSNVLYVGDHRRDIEAGKHAQITTAVAKFGYIPPDDDPMTWGADYDCASPDELIAVIWQFLAIE